MPGIFHWLRIQVFCYPTEKEDLVARTFAALAGTDDFETAVSENEHGSRMLIYQTMLTKQKDYEALFRRLGPAIGQQLLDDLENRIDDDDVFYTRLDKQQAVRGSWSIVHHGDVISITGKVAANPAKKEVAIKTLGAFLSDLPTSPAPLPADPQ